MDYKTVIITFVNIIIIIIIIIITITIVMITLPVALPNKRHTSWHPGTTTGRQLTLQCAVHPCLASAPVGSMIQSEKHNMHNTFFPVS